MTDSITKILRQRIEKIQEAELDKTLEQGYKAGKQQSLSIARDFEHVDMEGWEEY